jgi:branched-chain amino acid transport system substrate-binding protein
MFRHPVRLGAGFALIVSLVLVTCGSPTQANASSEIRIGVITTLSGALADAFGTPTVDAARLAVQAVNGAGGLDVGGRKQTVTLLMEDDQDNAQVATSAAQKLINQEGVAALIGPSISRDAIPVAGVAENARIPMISPDSTNPATTAGKKYVFRAAFIDPFQGRVIARFALTDLHARKAAVLYDIASVYNKGISDVFKHVFTGGGGRVVAFESYFTGDKNFRPQLARIKRSGATVLFLPNYADDVPVQARQARQAGIHATLLGADAWSTLSPADLVHLDGAFFSSSWNPNLRSAQSRAFVRAFRRAYNREPNDVAALTYDCVGLLFHAMQSQGKADPESIRSGLAHTTSYAGVTGRIGYHGSGDPVKSAVISEIKDGKIVLYKQVEP